MTSQYLRPPDLRTHLETLSGTPSESPRPKSVTTSTSRTSWMSSRARKLVKESRDGAVRAGSDKAGYREGHHESKSEEPSVSRTRDLQGVSALPGDLEIEALFDFVDRDLPQTLPQTLLSTFNLIPPSTPGSQALDYNMANANQAPFGV